ncbi:CDP-alcohol phosphatidyltransferase family protein [Candidatus Uhrbacteria bacterium]|nr:CDP-alcohol phosphatidyltransferase family protein [Candidatus Uhrbacteria bacterium]
MEKDKRLSRLRPLLLVAARLLAIPAIIATPWAETFLRTSDIWQFKAIVCIAGGLAVTLAWLAFPQDLLARIEANFITIGHLVLFWVGAYAFFRWSVYAGHLLIVSSAIWDVLDGKANKLRAERGLVRSKLNRWIGKWLDPLVDKATVLPFLCILAHRGIVNPWTVVAIVAFDVIGTFLREPFTTLVHLFRYPCFLSWSSRLGAEINRSLANEILDTDDEQTVARKKKFADQETKASWVGKVKSLVQNLGLEFCLPFLLYWVALSPFSDHAHDFGRLGWIALLPLPDCVFAVAAVLGAASVVSRHLPPNRFMVWANSFFKHQDVL